MTGHFQLSLFLGISIILSAVILCDAASMHQSSGLFGDDREDQERDVVERVELQGEESVIEGELEEGEGSVVERGEQQEEEGVANREIEREEKEGGLTDREGRSRGSNKRGNSKKKRQSNNRRNSNKQGNLKKRVPPKRESGINIPETKCCSSHNYTTECECGKKLETSRIVGGKPTTRDEYPWQAALLYTYDGHLHCGGSLINNLYVLTSAYCVATLTDPADLLVRLQDYNLNKPGQSKEITKNVEEIILHPNYEEDPRRADIALLKLDSPLTLSQLATVRPICLPSQSTELYLRERAIATGWGQTGLVDENSNVLKEVNMKVMSNSKCRNSLPYGRQRVKKNMLCAGNIRKNICFDDEGGPLAHLNDDGLYEQIGIASFTDGCGYFDEPAVFTRVNQFLNWIRTNAVDATYCTGFTFPGE